MKQKSAFWGLPYTPYTVRTGYKKTNPHRNTHKHWRNEWVVSAEGLEPLLQFMPWKVGAGHRNRTYTGLPPPDFESGASASSASPARRQDTTRLAPPGYLIGYPSPCISRFLADSDSDSPRRALFDVYLRLPLRRGKVGRNAEVEHYCSFYGLWQFVGWKCLKRC
jgi:hypothetical protein